MKKSFILWADDDEEDFNVINDVIKELNLPFEVVEVNNGKEALHTLHKFKQAGNLPCLIVLDINMPIMDGKETLSLIKGTEAFQGIPVVVFTTSSSEMDKRYFGRFQVEMLTKPPEYESLKEA